MTLRVAIVGCGYFSAVHQDAWKRMPRTEVVAVVDTDAGKSRSAAAAFPAACGFADIEAMFAATSPDVVDIVTPPATHRALIAAAVSRGVPVICQKPLAPTLVEAAAIVAETERAGVPLIIHENFRFMPWFIEAHRLLGAGTLGAPLAITFRYRPGDGRGPGAYLDRQPYFRTMDRFLIHETGIHFIDVFRYLLGEITSVFARLKRLNSAIAGEDAGVVMFDFANGAAGLWDGNRLLGHPAADMRLTSGTMLLEGTDRTLRLDGEGRLFLSAHAQAEYEHAYDRNARHRGGGCAYRQIEHIVAHLLDGAPVVNAGGDYLRNMIVEEAIYRSAKERGCIDL